MVDDSVFCGCQLESGGSCYLDGLDTLSGSLIDGVESFDGVDLVTEEVYAVGFVGGDRVDVD